MNAQQVTRILAGPEHPYLALMEHINEGAVTLSRGGTLLYANRFFADFLETPKSVIVGSQLRDRIAPDDHAAFDNLLAGGLAGGSRGSLTLLTETGALRPVLLSLSPLALMMDTASPTALPVAAAIGIITDLEAVKTAERRLGARMRQQAAIAELGQRALAGLPLDAIVDLATHLVAHTVRASACMIAEVIPDRHELRLRTADGAGVRSDITVAETADSLCAVVLRTGVPVIIDDATVDPRFSGSDQFAAGGVVSAIGVLVQDEESPFGVLAAVSPGANRFTREDLDFLQTVANVLSAAIMRRHGDDLRRSLIERLTAAQDAERRRLARELHDETRQSLWALVVGLGALETTAELAKARDVAQRLHGIAIRTLEDIGRLARGLHPGALDDHGLVPATVQYIQDFTTSYGIAVEHGIEDLADARLPAEVEIALYRILQEALTNVARHAQARSVRVTLRRRAAAVELTVADDGVGFPVDAGRSRQRRAGGAWGLGLHGMRERASMLGGELTVASPSSGSTTVTARIPLAAARQ